MWFRGLVIPTLVVLLFAASANAMPLRDYIGSLERMRNEPPELAAIEAKALTGIKVEASGGPFMTDASLLDSRAEGEARGGMLTIEWAGDAEPVLMTGPATTVFEGEIEL